MKPIAMRQSATWFVAGMLVAKSTSSPSLHLMFPRHFRKIRTGATAAEAWTMVFGPANLKTRALRIAVVMGSVVV